MKDDVSALTSQHSRRSVGLFGILNARMVLLGAMFVLWTPHQHGKGVVKTMPVKSGCVHHVKVL